MVATPTTLGYLRDTVTSRRLDFMFNPEDLPVEVTANYASHTPRGASHPRRNYTHTTGRKGRISLLFIRREVDATDVDVMRRELEALPFPDYDRRGQLRRGPHAMVLVFGSMRVFRVIVMSVKLAQGPHFLPETTMPCELRAEIEWEDSPEEGDLSHDEVRGGL